jgi:hypothetical protein
VSDYHHIRRTPLLGVSKLLLPEDILLADTLVVKQASESTGWLAKQKQLYMKYDIFKAVETKIVVFSVMTLCSFVGGYHSVGGNLPLLP